MLEIPMDASDDTAPVDELDKYDTLKYTKVMTGVNQLGIIAIHLQSNNGTVCELELVFQFLVPWLYGTGAPPDHTAMHDPIAKLLCDTQKAQWAVKIMETTLLLFSMVVWIIPIHPFWVATQICN
jgi:hypothetical protein